MEPSISLSGKRASASIARAATRACRSRFRQRREELGHYRSYAEVWGRDANGNELPVAWVGGMVTPSRAS